MQAVSQMGGKSCHTSALYSLSSMGFHIVAIRRPSCEAFDENSICRLSPLLSTTSTGNTVQSTAFNMANVSRKEAREIVEDIMRSHGGITAADRAATPASVLRSLESVRENFAKATTVYVDFRISEIS